jgi:transcriptional regulator with XRE-family HTH domain
VRDRLVELMEQRRVNQAELARRLGTTQNWVSRRRRGESAILADELPVLAQALGVDPCIFLRGDADEASPSQPTVGQEVTAAMLRHLENVEPEDLQQFFDFLEWRRARAAAQGVPEPE